MRQSVGFGVLEHECLANDCVSGHCQLIVRWQVCHKDDKAILTPAAFGVTGTCSVHIHQRIQVSVCGFLSRALTLISHASWLTKMAILLKRGVGHSEKSH
jgi:hypothetical protein